MCVDDNVFNIQTLSMLLKKSFKCEPEIANNGLEAVEKFKSRYGKIMGREG